MEGDRLTRWRMSLLVMMSGAVFLSFRYLTGDQYITLVLISQGIYGGGKAWLDKIRGK